MKKRALEKLDDAYGKANESQKAIIDFLRIWVENDEDAAEKITAAKKNPGGDGQDARSHDRKREGGRPMSVAKRIADMGEFDAKAALLYMVNKCEKALHCDVCPVECKDPSRETGRERILDEAIKEGLG